MDLENTGDTGFDLDSAMADTLSEINARDKEPDTIAAKAPSISEQDRGTSEQNKNEGDKGTAPPAAAATPPATTTETPPATREPPKSWSKDKHELWGKLPPDAQDYYETRERQFLDGLEQYKGDATYGRGLRDAVTPYLAHIKSQGFTEQQVVGELLNTHYRLTSGTPEQRAAAYREIGAAIGVIEQDPNDPLTPLNRQIQNVESRLQAREKQEDIQRREKAEAETQAFAADPANPYVNEVAQDMLPFIHAGMSLKDAYDKAVWTNPVTRSKEQAKFAEKQAAELRERAKQEAEAAAKAASTNVREANTRKAPTEPKGSMDDTMRDTLKQIRGRA